MKRKMKWEWIKKGYVAMWLVGGIPLKGDGIADLFSLLLEKAISSNLNLEAYQMFWYIGLGTSVFYFVCSKILKLIKQGLDLGQDWRDFKKWKANKSQK